MLMKSERGRIENETVQVLYASAENVMTQQFRFLSIVRDPSPELKFVE